MKLEDLTGKTFNYLQVLRQGLKRSGEPYWLCRCECGSEKEVRASHLKSGGTRSCGCKKGSIISAVQTKHGACRNGSSSSEYATWSDMRKRCSSETHQAYKDYGARGISVCERWSKFENFLADMGPRPTPDHSIDRIENDKGYSPENCKWSTKEEQANNRRMTRKYTIQGRTMSLSGWAKEHGLNVFTVRSRLWLGWTIESALDPTNYRPRRISE